MQSLGRRLAAGQLALVALALLVCVALQDQVPACPAGRWPGYESGLAHFFETCAAGCCANRVTFSVTEMCCGTEVGSYLRPIDSCIAQLKAQGPSRTCNESKEERSQGGARGFKELAELLMPRALWWS